MSQETILITGGFGCIGAETTKWLLRNSDSNVVVCSRQVSASRTERIFGDVNQSRLVVVEADVRDQEVLQRILSEQQVTRVIHLAGLQTPDCDAHRELGLQVNLAGTQTLIEAMKVSGPGIRRFVYASSAAVYGPRAFYPEARVPTDAAPLPVNVYGVWKLASEQIARLFHEDTGVATLSLRPGVLYGPGRDAGLTASPTTALKCVALKLPYEIPFRSRQDYLYAPDVGAAFAHATLEPFVGYGAFTLPSRTMSTCEIVAAMRHSATELGLVEQFKITVGSDDVPFICDLDYGPFLKAFPDVPHTALEDALHASLAVFREHVECGLLSRKDLQLLDKQECSS